MDYMHFTSLSTLFYFSCLNLRERALRPFSSAQAIPTSPDSVRFSTSGASISQSWIEIGLRSRSHDPFLMRINLRVSASCALVEQSTIGTHGSGMKRTDTSPIIVFPQSTPRLWKSGTLAIGIAAPMTLRTKSLLAKADAA